MKGKPCKAYIISLMDSRTGILRHVNAFLPHIAYALARGWLPVIDMQTRPTVYVPETQRGKFKAWELFFEQPAGIGLNDMKKNKKCKLAYCPSFLWYRWMPNCFPERTDDTALYAELFRLFVRYNRKTSAYLQNELDSALPPGKTKNDCRYLSRGSLRSGICNERAPQTAFL